MTPIPLSGLVAYPSKPPQIGQSILLALQGLNKEARTRNIYSWEENDIPGRFIQTEILRKISDGNIFIADITILNFNVIFEIGHAVGSSKRVILIKNESIKDNINLIRNVGIFDTLGYAEYTNSSSLIELIGKVTDINPIQFDKNTLSNESPVYLILPPIKGDIETHLIARVKKAKLFYRSFDPQEIGRLSAQDAIENVAKSHGIIVPLLGEALKHSEIHNYRAAFVAGLASGMEKVLLILQSGDEPVPIDYRDFTKRFRFPQDMDLFITEFATGITASMQSVRPPVTSKPKSFLQKLNLGASAAENEYRVLGEYYLVTDEFRSVERGDVQIVLGRKGSGKSALFFQLRDRLRQHKQNVIVDLKPEGFQLLKFKEQILDYLEEGTREHTITAFWEYLLLLEICYKLLENDRVLHTRNHKLYEPYQKLAETYASDPFISEGDFAERMLRLTQRISDDFKEKQKSDLTKARLSSGEITDILYRHDLFKLRDQLVDYLKNKESLWILFDNLDKGWPPYGVSNEDVLSLRCLLDAISKLQREFRNKNISTSGIVFIRNDVYEILIESVPDRGKISNVLIDWTDPALLLELLRRRFLSSELIVGSPLFTDIWHQICVSHINGEDTIGYMIQRCMMRPRSLIELVKHCRSHAINLGHLKIEVEDILQGEETYSNQVVNDINFEMQDILPASKDSIYEFIEAPVEMEEEQLMQKIERISGEEETQKKILDLLLWYGVLGFRRSGGESTFIYNVRYDLKRLNALLKNREFEGVHYVINPALWSGLEIKYKI